MTTNRSNVKSDEPPPREALFRRMFHAVIHELVPPNAVVEDMFKGAHKYAARMAIADLAASLLTHAVDDADELDRAEWIALVDEIATEMRVTILPQSRPRPH
jgi:hypothetical protein